jgi:hypothetical protein
MYKMYIRDKHDYDDLNKSSLGVQGPPGSTISRYKTNTTVTSGSNDGNEDDTRNAFYTLFISFLETVAVRVKPGEDDSVISLSITFLENFDVRVMTGEDDSDISFSITFLGFSHAYEGVLSMASYTYLELERLFKLPCTYESVSGDRNVIFLLSMSSNKSSVGNIRIVFTCFNTHIKGLKKSNGKRNIWFVFTCY